MRWRKIFIVWSGIIIVCCNVSCHDDSGSGSSAFPLIGDVPSLNHPTGSINMPAGNDEGWAAYGTTADVTAASSFITGVILNAATQQPIVNAVVQVRGINADVHTTADGTFVFPLTPAAEQAEFFLDVHALGFTSAYRKIVVHQSETNMLGTVQLTPLDTAIGQLTPHGGTYTNAAGTVQVVAPAGAVANTTSIRATDFHSGDAVPGPLPESSFFTYAVEFGPEGTQFAAPVAVRVKNTRGFAAGSAIPVGYFNKTTAEWEHEGTATISADGAWIEYTVRHFSPRDFNYPTITAPGAVRPTALVQQTADTTGLGDGRCGGSEVKLATGDLAESHVLPSYTLFEQSRAVALVYHSDTASVPMVQLALLHQSESNVANALRPEQIGLHATFAGQAIDARFRGTDDALPLKARFPAKSANGADLPTGLYSYRMDVSRYYTGRYANAKCFGCAATTPTNVTTDQLIPLATTRTGHVIINNQQASPFGAGWNIAGLRHVVQSADHHTLLLIDGDGTALTFTAGTIETIAGNGTSIDSGDRGSATSAGLDEPSGLAVAVDGSIFVAEPESHRVRKVDAFGKITTYVGTGVAGFSGDGGAATAAQLNAPSDLAVAADGTLYISDDSAHVVRRVDPHGVITTVAGTGVAGYSGDGGPATAAHLDRPSEVALDTHGTLFIADPGAHVVRKVSTDGAISTVAGTGELGSDGDLQPATTARLQTPEDIVIDALGNLYIADESANRIRRVNAAGVISTIAGTGSGGFNGDDQPAVTATVDGPAGIDLDRNGNLYISESAGARIRRISPDGMITTVAGDGTSSFHGDDNLATAAGLNKPGDVVVGPDDRLYIPDRLNHRVRRVGGDIYRSPLAPRASLQLASDGSATLETSAHDLITFNADGEQTQNVDRFGHRTTYTYLNHRLMTITDPLQQSTTFTYDAAGHVQSITDPQQRTTTFSVDANGNLTMLQLPDGSAWQYTYDDAHRVTTRTDPRHFTTQYIYDAFGKIARVEFPTGEIWQLHSTYGTDALTADTGTAAAPAAPLNATAATSTFIDGMGGTWSYRFDRRGFIIAATDPLGHTTTTERDPASRPTKIVTPEGRTTTFAYDDRGELTEAAALADPTLKRVFTYDDDGRVTTITGLNPNATTHYEYDAHDHVTKITDPVKNTRGFTYSADGLLATATDGENNITQFSYDDHARLHAVTDALGTRATFDYDPAGNLITHTDGGGHRTQQAFDIMNRLTERRDANGGVAAFTYTAPGCGCTPGNQITSLTDGNGNAWAFDYDLFDHLLARTDPLGNTESFTYDNNRRLATHTTRGGSTTTISYDAANRVQSVARPDDQLTFTYDNDGLLATAANNARTYAYTYDPLARPLTAAQTGTGPALTLEYGWHFDQLDARLGLPHKLSFDFDRAGRLFQSSAGSADYDGNNRMTSLCNSDCQFTQHWNYDARGRLTTTFDETKKILNMSYIYDATDNVTQQSLGTTPRNFDYDVVQQLLSATTPTEDYAYGTVGNRLTGPDGTTYTYGDANRLLALHGPHYGTLTYDDDGRITKKIVDGTTTAYIWNSAGLLAQVSGENFSANFTYDAFDRRIGATTIVNGQATTRHFVYDGPHRVADYDEHDSIQAEYLFGPGLDFPVRLYRNGNGYVYFTDATHTVRALNRIGGGNNNLTFYQYDAFGNITAATGPVADQPYTFTGREWDSATNLYYYRARYYDPALGRFLSEDPIGFAGGDLNLYRYVGNNPVNAMDPWGLYVTVALYPGAVGAGHIGLGVNTPNTTGFYPVRNSFSMFIGQPVPGVMQPDTRIPINTITISTTPQQDSAIQNFINERVQNPGEFDLDDRNCALTVRNALAAGGISTPGPTNLPRHLFSDLQQQFLPGSQ